MSGGLLGELGALSEARWRAAAAQEPLATLRARALETPPAPALRLGRFDVIAEVKLVAPSVGRLAAPADRTRFAVSRAQAYAAGGAAAISVLTEPSRFDGAPGDLVAVAAAVDVPVLRKDFLVDAYQVWEARAWGAGGALLIVRMLDDDTLARMVDVAAEAGIFVLLEAFDAEELARAGRVLGRGAEALVGVNTRDLVTLAVDPDRLASLAPALPANVVGVAESGLRTPEDAAAAARLGYGAALVGSALVQASDPRALVAGMCAAGGAAR